MEQMKFISAEEFLKQDEDVQRVFADYFDHKEMLFEDGSIYFGTFNYLYTPLLTEGDLREFIEDKTGGIEIIEHFEEYDIRTLPLVGGIYGNDIYEDLGNDLLQAYWKVAIKIAKRQKNKII